MKRVLIATCVTIGIVAVVIGGWWAIYQWQLQAADAECAKMPMGCGELF